MLIVYNQSPNPFMLTHHVDDSDNNRSKGLNKLLKLSYVYLRSKKLTRQCFMLLNDRSIDREFLNDLVEMNRPEVISKKNHIIVYGARDLNPMSWSDDSAKKRNIYFITLSNSRNTFFRVMNDKSDYAILEYSITSKEITFIIDHNRNIDKPFIFEFIDVANDSISRYEFTADPKGIVESNISKKYGGTADIDISNKTINKFKPPKLTQNLIADKGCSIEDSDLLSVDHELFTIDKNDVEDIERVIDYIKRKGVKAITWVGNINEDTKNARELIKKNFRVYYEKTDRGIDRVKIT